jgi:hypothetical protein
MFRADLAAPLTCSLERHSMPTFPRQRLVGFADYKQKSWDVNGKSHPKVEDL